MHRKNPANSPVVQLQAGNGRPPLYLVHGAGGGMLWGYANLARALGPTQPLYAFKSRVLAGLEEFATIEEMAAHYVAELRKIQPEGPYHLGGYCFGGMVAYEMARLLRARGERVPVLLLFNCWANASNYTRLCWTPALAVKFLWNLVVRLRFQLQSLAKRPQDYFKWRAAWLRKRLRAFWSLRFEHKIRTDDLVDLACRYEPERSLWGAHIRAWIKYQPRPYDGHILLLRTRGHPLVCSFDHEMGWGSFALGGVTVKICRGDHESILEAENVADAARNLNVALEELRSRTKTTLPLAPASLPALSSRSECSESAGLALSVAR